MAGDQMKILTISIYVFSIVLVNFGFSHFPGLELLWSVLVGTIFISRDFAQRIVGHWVLLAMAVAIVLSYLTADPFIALASCLAFAASEILDWAVFSITKGSFRRRMVMSSSVAVPVDSFVFLYVAGFLSAELFAVQITSKMVAVGVIAAGIEYRRRYANYSSV